MDFQETRSLFLLRCTVFSAVLLILLPAVALALKNGDLVVIQRNADLRVSGKVVGKVIAGEVLRVHGVRGEWVEVGDQTRGWVRTDNVLGEQAGLEHIGQLIEATPDDAKLWITRARMRMSLEGVREPELSQRLAAAEADLSEARQRAPGNAEVPYQEAHIALRRSEFDRALTKLDEAIALDPKDARLFAERARLHMRRGNRAEAMPDFEQVVSLKQADAAMYNYLAWWYATSTDSAVRNGKTAVKYATKACELTHYNNYAFVDTLAAAHAEDSDFPNAIRWQDEAIRICNDPVVKPSLEARLKQYRLDQPFRE